MKVKKSILSEIALRTVLTVSALAFAYVGGQMFKGPVFKLLAAFGFHPALEYQQNTYQFLPSAVFIIVWVSIYAMLANILADILLQKDCKTRRKNVLLLLPLIILPLLNSAIKACLGYKAQCFVIILMLLWTLICLERIRPITRFAKIALTLIVVWLNLALSIAIAALYLHKIN